MADAARAIWQAGADQEAKDQRSPDWHCPKAA